MPRMANRDWIGARCACAAVSGVLVALAAWAANWAVGLSIVSVPCTPAHSFGCGVGKFFAGLMIAVLLHVLLLLAVTMAAGGVLGWLAFKLMRVQISMPIAMFGPLILLVAGAYARHVARSGALDFAAFLVLSAVGYALAVCVTAPQLGRKRILTTIGLVAAGVALLVLS
jgi:hypothetical protein